MPSQNGIDGLNTIANKSSTFKLTSSRLFLHFLIKQLKNMCRLLRQYVGHRLNNCGITHRVGRTRARTLRKPKLRSGTHWGIGRRHVVTPHTYRASSQRDYRFNGLNHFPRHFSRRNGSNRNSFCRRHLGHYKSWPFFIGGKAHVAVLLTTCSYKVVPRAQFAYQAYLQHFSSHRIGCLNKVHALHQLQ